MTKEQIYNLWAPPGAAWSAWAKPVLFAGMDRLPLTVSLLDDAPAVAPTDADTSWVPPADGTTALVLDLPGRRGVDEGLALAALGYRPVPLYNACPDPLAWSASIEPTHLASALIEVRPIVLALASGAATLARLALPPDAPPAFLLDAVRRFGITAAIDDLAGRFDNRSISLPTDFPSANLLLSRGVRRVIVAQPYAGYPQADLAHTLRRWQQAGIEILVRSADVGGDPRPTKIPRPWLFGFVWHRLLVTLRLRRNPLGGYGARLPFADGGSGG